MGTTNAIRSDGFTYYPGEGTFAADASDLPGDFFPFALLGRATGEVRGFTMESANTGHVVTFIHQGAVRDAEGETLYDNFVAATSERGDLSVRIYND